MLTPLTRLDKVGRTNLHAYLCVLAIDKAVAKLRQRQAGRTAASRRACSNSYYARLPML